METNFYTNYSEVKFIDKLKQCIDTCRVFRFSVSFIKKPGLRLLAPNIEAAIARDACGQLITSTYQNFTDVDSLQFFYDLQTRYPDRFSCRLDRECFHDFKGNTVGFHSKGYLFEFEDHNELLVGSSNITVYALLKNIEWDVSVIGEENDQTYEAAKAEFDSLWDSTLPLTLDLISEYRTRLYYSIERWDMDYDIANAEVKPNYMQRRALKELNRVRAMGAARALVTASAGSGKTFLAAFDALNFGPRRLLYIVHEGSILMKSFETFQRVFGSDRSYGIFNGEYKEQDADVIIMKLIELDSTKQAFLETLQGDERTWFWMYLSGFSVDDIVSECNCSKLRLTLSLRGCILNYNQFVQDEKQKAAKKDEQKKQYKVKAPKAKAEQKQTKPKRKENKVFVKLKRKIDAQFDHKFFLGDIPVSQEEYAELLEYTKWLLLRVNTWTVEVNDPILAVALVQIGIRCYNDGNFWGNALTQELKIENTHLYQRYLGESFIRTLKSHDKFVLDESRRVQSILFHSFVTDYYSKGLFELLFQYYSKDLERDIYRNDKAQMQALMDTLKMRAEMTESESEAFTGQFMVRGSRAYRLRQHTLQAISANMGHSSMRLRRILRLMDNAFWKDSVPRKPVSRMTILFKEWINESPTFQSEHRLFKSGVIRNRGKKHFSSPYLFADIRNTAFSLVLPPQIVRQEQSEELYWHVVVGDAEYDLDADTYPVLTGFKTEEVRIPVPKKSLFSKISCKLISNGETVRSFPDLPEANARLFDMEGDYANRIFRIPMCAYTRISDTVTSPALLDRVYLGELIRWDLEFVNGDVMIFSNGKSMTAGERFVDGLTMRGVVENASYRSQDGNIISVYNRLPDLLLTLPKSKIAGTVLEVNGIKHRLSDCDHVEFDSADARGARAFLVSMQQFSECNPNTENRIILDIPGNTYAREYRFVYVPALSARFDGAPYVFEDRGTLVFPEGIQATCISHDAEPLHGENGLRFAITPELSTIKVRMNQTIDIDFQVPAFMWSSDEKAWSTEPMGDIWHSDFRKYRRLYFRSPETRLEFGMDDDLDDSDDQTEQHTVLCERRKDGVYVLDLTRFRSWITRDKVAYPISMKLGSSSYTFTTVYAKTYVASCDLSADYESELLICSADFIGQGEYFVDITHLQSGTKIIEKGQITTGELQLKLRPKNGQYQVEFFELEEDEGFFEEESYLSIHSFQKTLVNKNDLSGNHIRVLSIRPRLYSRIHSRLTSPLWIEDLEYAAPLTYQGKMKMDSGESCLVRVVFESTDNLRYFHLFFWDEYDESFLEFLFDDQKKTIVFEEEPDLTPSVRYRRYKVLYDTDFLFYGSVEDRVSEIL